MLVEDNQIVEDILDCFRSKSMILLLKCVRPVPAFDGGGELETRQGLLKQKGIVVKTLKIRKGCGTDTKSKRVWRG